MEKSKSKRPTFWDDPFFQRAMQRIYANMSPEERKRHDEELWDIVLEERYGQKPAKEGELPF